MSALAACSLEPIEFSPPSDSQDSSEFKLTREERAQAVEQWLPLVRKMAGRFMSRLGRYYEYEDLVSIGQLALWKASGTYFTNQGATFGTYSYHAVAHAFGGLIDRYRTRIRSGSRREESLDEVDDDGEATSRQLTAPELLPDALLEGAHDCQALLVSLEILSPRYRQVLAARFVEERSLEEIAFDLGVTRERVRQLELKALTKLRKNLARALPERAATAGARPVSSTQATPRGYRPSRHVPPGKVAPPPESP